MDAHVKFNECFFRRFLKRSVIRFFRKNFNIDLFYEILQFNVFYIYHTLLGRNNIS